MIHVENITYRYDGSKASGLRGISLTIEAGESVAVMGPNGSGKTTLARCLNALLLPTTGTVSVDGMDTRDCTTLQEIRRRVGMVFQNPDNQIVSATVEREIAFGLENLGLPYQELHERVDEMLVRFHLERYRYHSPHYLSGGEKQRLALAAVLAMRPSYLVLDEPTTLLDPKSRWSILNTLDRLGNTAAPISTLLITQFPEEALLADRLLVIHEGQLYLDDAPELIFEQTDRLQEIGLDPPVSFLIKETLKRYGMSVPIRKKTDTDIDFI